MNTMSQKSRGKSPQPHKAVVAYRLPETPDNESVDELRKLQEVIKWQLKKADKKEKKSKKHRKKDLSSGSESESGTEKKKKKKKKKSRKRTASSSESVTSRGSPASSVNRSSFPALPAGPSSRSLREAMERENRERLRLSVETAPAKRSWMSAEAPNDLYERWPSSTRYDVYGMPTPFERHTKHQTSSVQPSYSRSPPHRIAGKKYRRSHSPSPPKSPPNRREPYRSYGPRSPRSPGPRSPRSPGPRTPRSPGPRTPRSPGPRTPRSPGPRTPRSPGPRTPRSPGRRSSRSPSSRRRSPRYSPYRRPSPGPSRKRPDDRHDRRAAKGQAVFVDRNKRFENQPHRAPSATVTELQDDEDIADMEWWEEGPTTDNDLAVLYRHKFEKLNAQNKQPQSQEELDYIEQIRTGKIDASTLTEDEIKQALPRPIKQEDQDDQSEINVKIVPRRISRNPRFIIPVQKIFKQIRPQTDALNFEKKKKRKFFGIMRKILRLRFSSILKGMSYMHHTAIMKIYNGHYCKGEILELIKFVLEDIERGNFENFVPSDADSDENSSEYKEKEEDFLPYVPSKKIPDEKEEEVSEQPTKPEDDEVQVVEENKEVIVLLDSEAQDIKPKIEPFMANDSTIVILDDDLSETENKIKKEPHGAHSGLDNPNREIKNEFTSVLRNIKQELPDTDLNEIDIQESIALIEENIKREELPVTNEAEKDLSDVRVSVDIKTEKVPNFVGMIKTENTSRVASDLDKNLSDEILAMANIPISIKAEKSTSELRISVNVEKNTISDQRKSEPEPRKEDLNSGSEQSRKDKNPETEKTKDKSKKSKKSKHKSKDKSKDKEKSKDKDRSKHKDKSKDKIIMSQDKDKDSAIVNESGVTEELVISETNIPGNDLKTKIPGDNVSAELENNKV